MNKKNLFHFVTIIMAAMFIISSCGNNNNPSSTSEEQVLAGTEKSDDIIAEEQEPELVETNFSFNANLENYDFYTLKEILWRKEPNRRGWRIDNYSNMKYNIKMNYDDGSAFAFVNQQIVAKDDKGRFEVSCDTVIYEGTWKLRSIQRGNKYVDAYEFQLSLNMSRIDNMKDSYQQLLFWGYAKQISIYTTEKFDCVYVGYGKENDSWAYHNFYDGIKEYSVEVFDLKHIWK